MRPGATWTCQREGGREMGNADKELIGLVPTGPPLVSPLQAFCPAGLHRARPPFEMKTRGPGHIDSCPCGSGI